MTPAEATALLAGAATAVCADQASKDVAGRLLADGRFHAVALRSGFRWVVNPRGSLVAVPLPGAVVVWAALLAGALGAWVVAAPSPGVVGAVGLGLALGGATSNLADRLVRALWPFIAERWQVETSACTPADLPEAVAEPLARILGELERARFQKTPTRSAVLRAGQEALAILSHVARS